jgi:hypothetical protein
MIFREAEGTVFVRLHPGDSLLDCLCDVARQVRIPHLGIASAVGMVRDTDLAFFVGGGQYKTTHVHDPVELVSLAGNLVTQGDEILPHVHAALAREDKVLIGGHVQKATAHVTNEILLLTIPIAVRKAIEPESGLLGISFPDAAPAG